MQIEGARRKSKQLRGASTSAAHAAAGEGSDALSAAEGSLRRFPTRRPLGLYGGRVVSEMASRSSSSGSNNSSEVDFTVQRSTHDHDAAAAWADSSQDEDATILAAAAASTEPCCSVCFAQPAISPRSAATAATAGAACAADEDDDVEFVYCGECRRSYCLACDADFHASTKQTQHFRQATGGATMQPQQPDLSALIWDDLAGSSDDEDEARLVLQLNGTQAHEDDGAKLPVSRAARVLASMPHASVFHPSLQQDPYARPSSIVSPRSPSVRKQHMYRGAPLNAAAEATAFAASTASPPAAPAFAPVGPQRPLSASMQQRAFNPLAPTRAVTKPARPNSARVSRAAPRVAVRPSVPPAARTLDSPPLGAHSSLPPRSWGKRLTPASMLELHSEMARLKTLLSNLQQQRVRAAATNQRKLTQLAALARNAQEFARRGSAAQRPRQRSAQSSRELEAQIAVLTRENAALSAQISQLESACRLLSDVEALRHERVHWSGQLDFQRAQQELHAFKQEQLVEDLKAAALDLSRALQQKDLRLQSALAEGHRARLDADRLEFEYADLQHALDRGVAKQMHAPDTSQTASTAEAQAQRPLQPVSRPGIQLPQPPPFPRPSSTEHGRMHAAPGAPLAIEPIFATG